MIGDEQTLAVMSEYKQQLSMMKEGVDRLYESMHKVLGKVKVDFNFKTSGIIKMFGCLRLIRNRDKLRKKSKDTRQVLFFLKGREALDKEMDIGYVIRYVRILRYFLKTVLDKDQRVLLKLKSTEFIPSSDDERKPTSD